MQKLTICSSHASVVTNLTVTGQNFVDNSNKDQSYQSTIKKGRFKVKRVASGAQEDGFLK